MTTYRNPGGEPPPIESAADEWGRALARGRARSRYNLTVNLAAAGVFLVLAAVPCVLFLVWMGGQPAWHGSSRGPGRALGLIALPGTLIAAWLRRRYLARGQFG